MLVCFPAERATRLSFACQHTLPIGGEVQLTRLVVVLLLRHSSGGLSSGEDPSPSPRPQPCARVSGRRMASAGRGWQRFKTAASSLWALLFSKVDGLRVMVVVDSIPFITTFSFCLLPLLISSQLLYLSPNPAFVWRLTFLLPREQSAARVALEERSTRLLFYLFLHCLQGLFFTGSEMK